MCAFPRDCTYSAAKLPSWLESILIIVTVFSGDQVIESRQDQPEWLWRASCRAAYGLQELKKNKNKNKTTPLVPDIYPLPFMSCILALVGCTQSNEGSPSGIWVHLQARDSLCMISQQYGATSAKIVSFETNCCNLQKPAPIIHLVQIWILRPSGSPSTDSSVEVGDERRALQNFRTQSRCLYVLGHFSLPFSLPFGVCAFLSLIL